MKWLRTIVLINKGDVLSSADWTEFHSSYVRAIGRIDFPPGSGILKLRQKRLKPDGKWERNGVSYLKNNFTYSMIVDEKWDAELDHKFNSIKKQPELALYPNMAPYKEPLTSKFGGFDLTTITASGIRIAVEWETGNISSSHRSMNKLSLALAANAIDAGVLIVPSRELYQHLTDRIGNISELSGYLTMWTDLVEPSVKRGLLAISVVEHDELTDDPQHPFLKRGNDGRAEEGKRSKKKSRSKKKKKS